MAKEGGEDVYGTFNMLMRRKVGVARWACCGWGPPPAYCSDSIHCACDTLLSPAPAPIYHTMLCKCCCPATTFTALHKHPPSPPDHPLPAGQGEQLQGGAGVDPRPHERGLRAAALAARYPAGLWRPRRGAGLGGPEGSPALAIAVHAPPNRPSRKHAAISHSLGSAHRLVIIAEPSAHRGHCHAVQAHGRLPADRGLQGHLPGR